jgi:single-stranded-DNA-specific exonuclease
VQPAFVQNAQAQFKAFVDGIDRKQRIVVLCHSDADGVAAGAILVRSLRRIGFSVVAEVTGKGENAWSPSVLDRLRSHNPHALIVTDLGSKDRVLLEVPTLLIDHHRPLGAPPDAQLITGYGEEPTPTSGLLAYWCCEAITDVDDLCWIAAVSLLSDIGDNAPFALLDAAKARYKATPLRDATTLINAPRRSAMGDARPALDLLLQANDPRDVTKGSAPQVDQLKAAKAEVNAAFAEAKKASPKFSGNAAMIRIHTPCQIHPLIAQIWRTRLPKYIVMGVNTGYLPGLVNFSARSGREINVLQWLRDHAPVDPGEWYGNGHDQASGGALPYATWNVWVRGLGFGAEMEVGERLEAGG